MIRFRNTRRKPRQQSRRGVAAVEMAVAATMLVIMLMGMTGTAQFIMMHQMVSNASRAAARHAVRASTTSDTDVENTVQDYLERGLPSVSSSTISGALTVNVLDENGTQVTALDSIASGDELAVEVQFTFDAVRWLPNVMAGRTVVATTAMRRN